MNNASSVNFSAAVTSENANNSSMTMYNNTTNTPLGSVSDNSDHSSTLMGSSTVNSTTEYPDLMSSNSVSLLLVAVVIVGVAMTAIALLVIKHYCDHSSHNYHLPHATDEQENAQQMIDVNHTSTSRDDKSQESQKLLKNQSSQSNDPTDKIPNNDEEVGKLQENDEEIDKLEEQTPSKLSDPTEEQTTDQSNSR